VTRKGDGTVFVTEAVDIADRAIDARKTYDLHSLSRAGAWVSPNYQGADVNKNELVDTVAERSGLKKNEAEKTVDAVFDTIATALRSGDEVRIVGFGTFSVSERAATEGRNPRTGEKMLIAASKQPKFRAGKGLKDAIR
jgi:DNA-binding protein HU-beta